MKFCYLDESGTGSENILVMAGIIVDAQRMHITKNTWNEFLTELSDKTKRNIHEFHTRDFYSGNGPWRTIDGPTRSLIIEAIINWIGNRKHKITFSAIKKDNYELILETNRMLQNLHSPWCASALHSILTIQKHCQTISKNKGHTVLVFDKEISQEKNLTDIVFSPPEWADAYYAKKANQLPLDQIVDVPFFIDSKNALLIQVVDLISYILRTYAELKEGYIKERYKGESQKMALWTNKIIALSLDPSTRYPAKGRCPVSQLFWELAPACLRR